MATPDEQKYAKLEALFKMVTDSITKEEFVAAFEVLRTRVAEMESSNQKDFKLMREAFAVLSEKLKQDAALDVGEVKAEVLDLWQGQEDKIQKRLDDIDTKVAAIKEGEDGEDGHTPTPEELTMLVLPMVENAMSHSEDEISQMVEMRVSQNLAKYGDRIRDALELLPEGSKLAIEAIEGLKQALESAVQPSTGTGTTAGWGAHPITIMQSGVTKAKNARMINFTGATVTVNGSGVITIAVTGGGATAFTGLSDVPASYTGQAGKAVRVKATEDGLEFFVAAGSGTVTSVASADASVTITNPTTTVDLAVVKAPKLTTARTLDGVSFDGTANVTIIAPATHAATGKTTPVDADELPLADSAASFVLKKLTWANLKATLKTYLDTLYQPLAANLTSWAAITRASGFDTFVATPSSANLISLITDESGTGALVFANAPTLLNPVATTQSPSDNSTKVATTAYVDAAVLGQNFKEAALVATTANLVGVYVSGVFTYTATGTDTIDGVTLALGNRVLVKNQTTTFQNGIYTVTTAGALGIAGVLTRAPDANTSGEFKTGDSIFVTSGTVGASTTWAYTGVDSPTIGTDAITYAQSAGQGTVTSGNGITVTGLSVAIDTSVTVDKTTAQTLTNKTLTTPIIASISNSGTITVPTGTDTLVARATTDTLTNKRNQPRTASSTTASTLTPDLSAANVYYRTTQTATLTINAPTGTPVIGETIAIYVDAAGAQTLTMDATYIPFGAAFPASLTAGKTCMITAQYSGTNWKTLWANAV